MLFLVRPTDRAFSRAVPPRASAMADGTANHKARKRRASERHRGGCNAELGRGAPRDYLVGAFASGPPM